MSKQHNEQELFVADPSDKGTAGVERAVRATLGQRATSVPLQDPPVAQLLSRGRNRRRRRDALRVAGALAVLAAGVVGVNAARDGALSEPATATSQVVGVASPSSSASGASTHQARYHATVPKNWKPGAKLPLSTYSSLPNWVQATNAAVELGNDKAKGHHVNLGVRPEPATCLTLGSSPIAWPEGFYAEGSPLVVFDPAGRPVYVVDQGFTGADGTAELGYGDGVHLLPGLTMTHCPAQAGAGLEPYALAMIFPDAPRQ